MTAAEKVDWRQKAVCDPTASNYAFDTIQDLMEQGHSRHVATVRLKVINDSAKQACSGCPVRQQCLESAMVNGEEYGVWGGYTPEERLTFRPTWLKIKNLDGPKPKRPVRDANRLHHQSGVDSRYRKRLDRVVTCLDRLAAMPPTWTLTTLRNGEHSKDAYVNLLELVKRNPAATGTELAARIGRSKGWFNDLLREVFAAMDV